jgi:5-methylcytosine-specific restriction endonuclease McrBC regulatory subunit McrC
VGRARLGEVEVEVREKVRGTLVSLIGAATGAEVKIEKAESPATEFDLVSRHLMAEFIDSAGRYIADRRRPRNRYRAATGPVLAGALDMPATMRLHASGRPGLFAYRQCEVVRDEPLDRLVLAGLAELDRSAGALRLDSTTLYDARWLAGALDEVRDRRFLNTSRNEFLAQGEAIAQGPETLPADADLARLASVALLHQGFEPGSSSEDRVPRAWFLSLEDLFEQAVRNALRQLLADHEVDRGEAFPRRMFHGGADASAVNPDIVVHRDGAVTVAGDVKYKHLGGGEDAAEKEGRPDLYQVLVHAASLGANRAFLVYPSDGEYLCRYLGSSATGCRTWAVRVRPTSLAGDLARFLDEIGPL